MNKISVEDITSCWPHALDYLADILNGDYPPMLAREDLESLIGSKFDPRTDSKSSPHGLDNSELSVKQ